VTLKLVGWGTLALAVVFGAGWFVGASGRAALEQDRREATALAEFATARAFVLEGRVNLFQSNFGEASRAFDAARGVVERTQARLRQLGDAGRAGQLEVALAQLRDAQQLSLALKGEAQAAADQALRAIDAVASAAPRR
jgi:hypothetical protein